MKDIFKRTISFFMMLITVASVSSCGQRESYIADSSSSSDTTSAVTDASSSSVGIASSDTTSDTLKETVLSAEELEKYSYMPQISEIMPIINIITADSSFDFVTQYRREDKLQGLIDYVDATVTVTECDAEHILNGVEAEVKVRGNYTLNYDKKPIRIKFAKKQGMLGLHGGEKYKNWVLLADWKDLSMLNNSTSFYLGNTILGSDGFYCTDYRNVEVYINNTYWGVYLLAEQQELKDGRMSAPEVPDGYMGTDIGYMLEYDSYYTEERDMPDGKGDPTFEISYSGAPYKQCGYTVKSDINSSEQLSFLQNYLEKVFMISYAAVSNENYMRFDDNYYDVVQSGFTSAKETVGAVIDLQSLVDTYIINEIACDSDIAWSSFYMSVDMTSDGSKKLVFEAPWDFDSAFGMKKKFTATEGLFAANSENPWLSLLSHEDWFIEMVKEKWRELACAGIPEKTLELILKQKEVYKDYYIKNYEKWTKRITQGNGEVVAELNRNATQAQAADYLYNWLNKRFDYLNRQWGNGV